MIKTALLITAGAAVLAATPADARYYRYSYGYPYRYRHHHNHRFFIGASYYSPYYAYPAYAYPVYSPVYSPVYYGYPGYYAYPTFGVSIGFGGGYRHRYYYRRWR